MALLLKSGRALFPPVPSDKLGRQLAPPPAPGESREASDLESFPIWFVRLGRVVLSGLTAMFIYQLARRFLVPPAPAAVLSVLTPAFWLSSYALLIDSTLLFFFLGGLCAWIEGLKRGSAGLKIAAGLAMGLAILTK